MQNKKVNFIFLLLWPIIASVLCFSFSLNGLESVLVYYVLPSLYVSYLLPKRIKKTAFFALAGALIWISLDYVWELTGAWVVVSAFSTKLLGNISIESVVWVYVWIYWIIICYQYFWDKKNSVIETRKRTYGLFMLGLFTIIALSICVYKIGLNLYIPYSYLILGTIACLLPSLSIYFYFPSLRKKLVSAGIYFMYATILYEGTALSLHYWYFPSIGQFIFLLPLFGYYIPIEEIIIWIIFGSTAVIGLYELLDDDEK